MDQNLTGFITADVNLYQTWWALLLIVLGGAFSAGIGAAAVYYTTKRGQEHERALMVEKERYEKSRMEEKECQEKDKMRREERKNVYINFLTNVLLCTSDTKHADDAIDVYKFAESLIAITELGSQEVIKELSPFFLMDITKREIAIALIKKLQPIIAEELQGEDIYVIADALAKTSGSLEKAKISSEEK